MGDEELDQISRVIRYFYKTKLAKFLLQLGVAGPTRTDTNFRPREFKGSWLKFNQEESLAPSHTGNCSTTQASLLFPLCISVPVGTPADAFYTYFFLAY